MICGMAVIGGNLDVGGSLDVVGTLDVGSLEVGAVGKVGWGGRIMGVSGVV